ncbi:helix-turn-helix transcriptional regulator [Microbacterium sp. NPDC089318]
MATANEPSVVGRRLSTVRKARGLSAAQLADLIPGGTVSKTVITNVESGRKRDLTVKELVLVAHALNVSPVFLIVDPRSPWEPVDVPGVDLTNVEYARRADIFYNAGAFWGGAGAVETALAQGEESVRTLDEVRRVLASVELGHSRWEDSILRNPNQALQDALHGLVLALDTLHSIRERDSGSQHLGFPVVERRIAALEAALDEVRQEYPHLVFKRGIVRWNDGTAPDPAE